MNDLNRNLDAAAGDGPARLDLGALHGRAATRRRRRRAGVVGGTVAAGILVLGIAVGLTSGGSTPTSQLTAGEGTESSTTADPAASSTTTTPEGGETTTSTVSADPEITTTTEATAPTTTATVPLTATPRGILETGTFESTPADAFTIGERCPQIVSELDAAMTTSHGETWALHEDGCGELQEGMTQYSGGGPFTITTGAGDVLTGDYSSNAPLPTDGEPYSLTITGGTGRWTGATGTCDLDNHMETLDTGKVRQFGTFACTISLVD